MKPDVLKQLKKYVYTTKPFNSEDEGFAIVVYEKFIAANRDLAHQVLNKGSKVHLRSVACPRAVTDATVLEALDYQNILMMKLNGVNEEFPYFPRESYGEKVGRKVISVGCNKDTKDVNFSEGVIESYRNGYCYAQLENGAIGNGIFNEHGEFFGTLIPNTF
ncbi:hypothetical protein CRE_10360 [Caenorhabditis remanei]|uniref:Uncharacterized protein n=1 Tax=Caenorhabditis remanei TaxID=31234 RepID=E3MQJ7_CAERE|nr:hypothetical protein CRE_10360 [Caenorhabditis remanei]